jgi:protein SCO1/2
MSPTRILHILRWTALALIVLVAAGIAFIELSPTDNPKHLASTSDRTAGIVAVPAGVPIGGPFTLVDDKSNAVTDANYRGRWMLVFFGYTNCPDECPLTLQKIATALSALGPLADQVAPLFVTVDPAHDPPERLAQYLANFDRRIAGLTGSDEQIAAVAKAYRVYYSPEEHEQSGVDLVSHSTFLYLMNPSGKLDLLFSQDIDADKLTDALRTRLSPERQSTRPS